MEWGERRPLMSVILALVLSFPQAAAAPVYKWEPGLELTYRVETELHYGGKPMTRRGEISLLVLGNEPGKGALVGVTRREASGREPGFGLLWVTPEGKFRLHDLVRGAWWGACPLEVLPPLPGKGKGPWRGGKDLFGTSLAVTGSRKEKEGELLLSFRFVYPEGERKVYGRKGEGKAWFDPAGGYVTKVSYERGMDRFPRSVRAKVTLSKASRRSARETASFRSALEDYLGAQAEFYGLGSWLPRDEKEVAAKVKEINALFEGVAARHAGTPVAGAAKAFLGRVKPSLSRRLEEAKRFRGLLGKKAPDVVLPDLEGKKHALSDYRGKVAVLDFWYRGCGWCTRAVPMVKAAFARLAGKPVVFLGMNVDRRLEDALLAEKALEPPYPSLHTDRKTAKRFGVRGYPTFVILDKERRFAGFQVGWAPDLADILVKKVTPLLK